MRMYAILFYDTCIIFSFSDTDRGGRYARVTDRYARVTDRSDRYARVTDRSGRYARVKDRHT